MDEYADRMIDPLICDNKYILRNLVSKLRMGFTLPSVNLRQIIIDYIRCFVSRKEVLIIYSWTSLVGLCIIYRGLPPLGMVTTVFAVMSFTGMSVYFYNDYVDYDDDLISKDYGNTIPYTRPLGQGLVRKETMFSFIIINGILGLTMAAQINLNTFLLMSSFIILGYLYSTSPFKLKKRRIMKQLTISLGGVIACSLGGAVSGIVTPNLLFFTLMSFLMFFGVNPIIDIRDIEGDRATGVKSFPIILGPRFTVHLAIVTLTASMLANIVGYYQFGYSTALPILGGIVLLSTILVIRPLLTNWNNAEFLNNTIARRMHPIFLLLQLTYLIGSIPLI